MLRSLIFIFAAAGFAASALGQGPPPPPPFQPLQPPPVPPQNPITANKSNLGKVLFWDEQLSSTRTISCGTCHQPAKGGADPRATLGVLGATNPGPDGTIGTADDVTGSPGVPLNNADGTYDWSAIFGMNPQVTGRYPPPAINSGYPPNIFWDGRATSQFTDPLSGAVVIPAGGALESQAAGPPTSDAEMAHQGRDWTEIAARVEAAKPLALATNTPAALTSYINNRDYPALFTEAFGSAGVTPQRIIMAIATYERELNSDQTPLDLGAALTPQEVNGRNIFNGPGRCATCHGGNRFTDDNFHYIGLRPNTEDPGRFNVTGNANDMGRFKTPGLRNVELRGPFMHNGQLATLTDVVNFYNRGGDFNAPNKNNNVRPLGLNTGQVADLVAFMSRPMTDPRVAAETAPFDRPDMFAGSAREPQIGAGAGNVGSGGLTPQVVAIEPPAAGNPSFTVAMFDGLGGAEATLVIDAAEPAANPLPNLATVDYVYETTLTAGGNGEGRGSVSIPIADIAALAGTTLHGRWYVADPAAAGGHASSSPFTFQIFAPHFGQNVKLGGLAASDSTSTTQVDLTWDPAIGAALYRVFRHTADDFGAASQVGTSATPAFSDATAAPGVNYFYWVTVDGDEGQTVPSDSDAGRRNAPNIPANLAATDGTHLDKVAVTWDATAGAASYQVFRHTADNFASATQIGTPATNSFDDATADVGRTYFYWVKAVIGGVPGTQSASDSGFRGVTPPANLVASDGTSAAHVALTWNAVADASSYRVLRHTANDSSQATSIATPTATNFNDTTGDAARTYFYWVRATVNGSESDFSASDQGVRALAAAGGVAASMGSSADHVALSWTAVADANTYQIFRHTSNDFGSATQIGTANTNSFNDPNTTAGDDYFYWIVSVNDFGTSVQSASVSGSRALPAPVVTASDGTHNDRVVVSWAAVADATSYRVFRHTANDFGNATQVALGAATSFDDTSVVLDQVYFYWVRAENANINSAESSPNTGFSSNNALAAPTGIEASDNDYFNKVMVRWDAIRGATAYRVFRNTVDNAAAAADLGTSPGLWFLDTTAVVGTTYFYWVKAENGPVQSPFSVSDTGTRANGNSADPVIPQLEPPPVPAENPITAAKAYLGRALFWDEQLSSTRTIACATCHQPAKGGADPRAVLGQARALHPGQDGIFGNGDDVTGSPGVVLNRADGLFDWSDQFGYREQVTGRYPPPAINAAYSPVLFWDGRATSDFRDQLTDAVVIAAGGALESQAAGPPTSPAEMAHQGRDWNHVASQISTSKPLVLARNVPTALETWINSRTYPELFDEAFGTPDVTPARIAMAIATFERTQFSDRSPHDRAVQQIQPPAAAVARGRGIFGGQGRCTSCHVGPTQSDNQFHYIGVRPLNNSEDPGRFAVTGVEADRGRFRTPGLRNVGLRGPFMHDGSLPTLQAVVDFYNRGGDFNAPTKHPDIRPLGLNGGQRADLVAFLQSLTDLRVQNETAPFDRPDLFADSARAVAELNPGSAGSGGLTPEISAFEPPVAGNPSFTLGVSNGLGGANAILVIDASEPAANAIPDLGTVDYSWSTTLSPGGNGQGRVSVSIPIADLAALDGTNLFGRWYVADPAAAGGAASSPSFDLTIFAPALGNNVAVNNVQASDETSPAQIDVTWDPVLGAPSYRVWRHTSNDFGSATQIATPTAPTYTDAAPPNGETRFYWITVDGDGGQTIPSAPDSGAKALEAPANLVASSDTSTEHIALGWDAVAGATGYRIHRGITANFGSSVVIATIAGTSHNDTSATPGRVFNYWIVAENANTNSAPSVSAAGSRSLSAPANVAASDGTFGHRVLVNWSPSTGAITYAIFRNTANDFGSASQVGVTGGTTFDDTTVAPLENNFYWVLAQAPGFQSAAGGPDTGNRTGDGDGDNLEDSWELAFYGNLDVAGPEDTDLDGWTVLEEYGFGADPQNPGSSPDIRPEIITIGPDQHFGVSFPRRKVAGGLLYETTVSGDLSSWSGAGLTEHMIISVDSTFERVTVRETAPIGAGTQKFGQVDISTAP